MNKVMHGATRVLRDVLLFDGVGEPPVPADVAIAGEYITAIGAPGSLVGEHIIEAQGLALAPGFIDVHTHDDRALLMPGMMSAKLSQGVTTVITGNCGLSLAPAQMAHVPAPLDLIATPEWLRFPRFADYLAALTNDGIAVNAACMVGHTTLRASVSATSRSSAPASTEPGSVARWSAPSHIRTRCGTTRPTKPITPLTATAAATSRALHSSRIRCTAATSTPR